MKHKTIFVSLVINRQLIPNVMHIRYCYRRMLVVSEHVIVNVWAFNWPRPPINAHTLYSYHNMYNFISSSFLFSSSFGLCNQKLLSKHSHIERYKLSRLRYSISTYFIAYINAIIRKFSNNAIKCMACMYFRCDSKVLYLWA